ncbi:MAG: M28 family peptidase [Gemmatimonadales bacterium]
MHARRGLAALLVSILPVSAGAQDAAQRRLAADVAVLAADRLEGRLTGSAGALAAAEHIAGGFRRARLRPGMAGGWFQDFRIAPDAPALHGTELAAREGLSGRNVVAVLPGRDPALRGEAVVIGAHYDHLGRGVVGSRDTGSTALIHNGADDNASGTATLLEAARILAAAPPRRTVVFVAFSGEELGLLGSGAYVREPAVPMERTVAMINLDMVGRLRSDRLMALGAGTAAELRGLLDSLNREAGFELRAGGDGYGASDHQSFYLARRPVIHFFTDLHEDYHRASDDPEKLNVAGMARIARFTAALAGALGDRTTPLTFVEAPRPAPVAGSRGYGTWLGTIPDMSGGGPGVRLSGVTPGSPAEGAGLRANDVLLRLGSFDIADLQAMTNALRSLQPGDTVPVVVRRGERIDTVRAVLGRRAR